MSNKKLPIIIPKYHWRPDRLDKRDFIYLPNINEVKLPDVKDLREHCTPIENQGMLGSCTGQAIAGAIELLNKRNKKQVDVSRLYIYYYERMLLGTINYDSGAYIRDGIKVCYKYGAPLERFWPYLIERFKNKPNSKAVVDGSKRKITLYERVLDHEGCIDALSQGYPVIVGFKVYQSFETSRLHATGIMPYPNVTKEKLLGGHAVLLVGYDKKSEMYITRNSWGSGWGDKGYFYMPFNVIRNNNMSSDFWVIKNVNNP